MPDTLTLSGEARELALAETQLVRDMAQGEEMRDRLTQLEMRIDGGCIEGEAAALLESVLELGLQAGRIRAVYGPGGEQTAIATLRRLPRGRERGDSTRAVTTALSALKGKPIEAINVRAVSPGAFLITIAAGGIEASVRLDGSGARIASIAT